MTQRKWNIVLVVLLILVLIVGTTDKSEAQDEVWVEDRTFYDIARITHSHTENGSVRACAQWYFQRTVVCSYSSPTGPDEVVELRQPK